jgi:two-component system chemotaxis response regulator CheB
MAKKVSVLIIDDSAVVRKTLEKIFLSDPEIEVIGSAADPFIAAKKISERVPDVITLDIEMPKMDGLTFLQKIMSQHPIPVVVISTLVGNGSETANKAKAFGALEVLEKPKVNTKELLEESKAKYCRIIKEKAKVKIQRIKVKPPSPIRSLVKLSENSRDNQRERRVTNTTQQVIAIGASTGGTEAIKKFLIDLPLDCPGIVIVQHMPELFTKQFADRLNSDCRITVKEAKNGDAVLNGHALIAPGNHHMYLRKNGTRYYVEVKDGPAVNRHKPSVDVLFKSVSKYAGKNGGGILLTGMGSDGSKGLLEMKESGAKTIAQDEASSIVFGMPKSAIELGAADYVLPLDKIANKMLKILKT